jgi:hypothetical protein
MTTVTADRTLELADYLHLLGYGDDELLSVLVIAAGQDQPHRDTGRYTAAGLVKLAANLNGKRFNLWHSTGVVGPGRGRGKAADVVRIAALAADLDLKANGLPNVEAAMGVISDLSAILNTAPTYVTMSGHGYQPVWQVDRDDSADLARMRPLLRRWGLLVKHVAEIRGGLADSVWDASRVLRTPGGINWKDPDKPVAVTAVAGGGSPISAGELEDVLTEHNIEDPGDNFDGTVLAAAGTWSWANRTCTYITTMIDNWATDTPRGGRHQWAMGKGVKLHAAHRLGCITEVDYTRGVAQIVDRMETFCTTLDKVRTFNSTEVTGPTGTQVWARRMVETFTDDKCRDELGDHHQHKVDAWTDELHRDDEEDGGGDDDHHDDQHHPDDDELEDGYVDITTGEIVGFWDARDYLQVIRDHARARRCPPDTVLAVVLAMVCTEVGPHVVLPALVGSEASLNLYVGLAAESSGGKSSALAAAADLHPWNCQPMPLGSGEGLLHAFVRRVKVEGRMILEQHTQRQLAVVDEVDQLTALGDRQGATLLPTLRTMWQGSSTGFGYADPTKRLTLGAHKYRLALVVGIQPERAGALLEDTAAGTPQRFVWASTVDAEAPDERPPPAGALPWRVPSEALSGTTRIVLQLHPDIVRYVDDQQLARLKGNPNAQDGHAILTREKVAALLALLGGRLEVNLDDWKLAGEIMARSAVTRKRVERVLADKAAEAGEQRQRAEADRAVHVDDRLHERQLGRVARTIAKHVHRHKQPDGCTRSCYANAIASRDRRSVSVDDAIGLAESLSWVSVERRPHLQKPDEIVLVLTAGKETP